MEIRRQNWEAARRAKGVIYKAYEEFASIFQSDYKNPFFDEFMTEDADTVLVGMGTVTAAAKSAVKLLRGKGEKVGYIKLRWFRPFPSKELREALSRTKFVGVIDRDFAHGSPDDGGVLFNDVRAALYRSKNKPPIVDFIGGLAGREIAIQDVTDMFRMSSEAEDVGDGDLVRWIRVRESSGNAERKVK
jgi:pyruvate ferredoxin oxidoreductase alpha subunit